MYVIRKYMKSCLFDKVLSKYHLLLLPLFFDM